MHSSPAAGTGPFANRFCFEVRTDESFSPWEVGCRACDFRHGPVASLAEAARIRGVTPADVVKTLVVRRAEDDFLFVLVPGNRTISWPKLRAVLGVARLSMPDASVAREVTGYERGTITPLGAVPPWPAIADERIAGRQISLGAGQHGVATTTSTSLSNLGFNVVGTGDAANFSYTSSVIEYGSASQVPEVNTLKKELPGVQVQQTTGLQPGTIALIQGSKFTSLAGGKTKSRGPAVAAASQGLQGISGDQKICKDTSALTGPPSPVPAPPGTVS